MAVDVHRRKNESFDSLMRRFTRKVQMSGRQVQAKKVRFYERTPSKGSQRHVALQRAQKRGYFTYLEKIGKLDDELAKLRARKRSRRR